MNEPKPLFPIRLEMACSYWLRLSMMIFGVQEAQSVFGHRILNIREMITLSAAVGKFKDHMMHAPTYAWHLAAVPLEAPEVAVLLKVAFWYEDALLKNMDALEKLGEHELTKRYENITQIIRAIQTAPKINSDQLDC